MRYVMIPAYEPNETLLQILAEIKKQMEGSVPLRIILINDGSGAEYDEIFHAAAQFAVVLKHEQNRGKGAALKTGFRYIKSLDEQTQEETPMPDGSFSRDVVVTADADGQHRPEDILAVCKACEDAGQVLVTGSRKFKGKIPLRSRMGNTITKYVFFLATGVKLGDTQCGLRAFPVSMLPFLCRIAGDRYEYEMNMLLEGALKIPIREESIETVYIGENETSHFRTLKDSWMIYKEIFKFAVSSVIGFLVDYLGYALLIIALAAAPVEIRLVAANVAARICSATLNFTLNKKYVFRSKGNVGKAALKYGFLAGCILTCNTLLLLGLNRIGLENPFLIKVMAELCLFLVSWMVQRRFVFREKAEKKGGRGLYGHHKDL